MTSNTAATTGRGSIRHQATVEQCRSLDVVAAVAMEGNPTDALFRLPSLERQYKPNPPPVYLGILLIIAGVISVGLSAYTTIAKILSPAVYGPKDMMRSDWYYALLFPLTLPVTVVAVYLHWLSMKLFKHA